MSARERILTATLDLITEHGVTGLTMSAIANRADVARQTLYNHYPDVESVVYAATVAHQHESFNQLEAMLATIDSAPGRLEHLVRYSAVLGGHGHPPIKGGFSAAVAELIAKHDRELRGLVEETLRLGRDGGEFRSDLDVEVDAALIQRMIEACGEIVARNPDDLQAIVATTMRSVLAAVSA